MEENSVSTEDVDIENNELNMPIALRKKTRTCTLHPIGNFVSNSRLSASCRAISERIEREEVPATIEQAIQKPEWKEVVVEEMQALRKNNTWEVVDLPKEKKTRGM